MALNVPLRNFWPALAAAASVVMLGTAHAFETFGGYAPCTLCLRQREVYWAALALALIGLGLIRAKALSPRALDLMLAAVFLAGATVAIYHAGAEWKFWPGPTSCSGVAGGVGVHDLSSLLAGAKVRPPACDEAAWRPLPGAHRCSAPARRVDRLHFRM